MSADDPLTRMAAELSPDVRAEAFSLYAALGDSFTAGTGCTPGEAWPERLAAGLRARSPALELRNLAVHGATSADVTHQLPEALELEPDLVSVVCGANDVLGRVGRPDVVLYARRLGAIFLRLRRANPAVRIVTATAPDRWDFLGLGPRTSARLASSIAELNRATRAVARVHRVACVDVAGHPGLSDPENFSADGLHPSPLGHQRAAHGFARALHEHFGIETTMEGEADDI